MVPTPSFFTTVRRSTSFSKPSESQPIEYFVINGEMASPQTHLAQTFMKPKSAMDDLLSRTVTKSATSLILTRRLSRLMTGTRLMLSLLGDVNKFE